MILSKLGPAGKFLEEFVTRLGGGGGREGDRPEIPQARGSIAAVRGQAFFIPLYELFLTYGGIFRLNFGPKVITTATAVVIFSDFFLSCLVEVLVIS